MAVSPGGFVTLDCADPTELATFWASMLGGDVIEVSADVIAVRTSWVWPTAVRIDPYTPPTWPSDHVPKQMHLDLAGTDLDEAAGEAERLGCAPPPISRHLTDGESFSIPLSEFVGVKAHPMPLGPIASGVR